MSRCYISTIATIAAFSTGANSGTIDGYHCARSCAIGPRSAAEAMWVGRDGSSELASHTFMLCARGQALDSSGETMPMRAWRCRVA